MSKRVVVLTVAALLVSCAQQQTQSDVSVSIPVSVSALSPKSIQERVVVTGTVYAAQETELTSQIAGQYRPRKNPTTGKSFALGDFVKKGQAVAGINDAEYANNIRLESEKLSLDFTRQERDKFKSLFEKGGASQRDLQNAELALSNAVYAFESAQLKSSKMSVTAPFDGIIVSLPYYTPGTRIASGVPLVKIMDYRKLYMSVNLPAQSMGRLHPGQAVRLSNYSLPDDTIKGAIDQVSPAIDPATRTFEAVIFADNPDWKFRPGMFVKAEVVVAQKDSTVVIPKDIIITDQNGSIVFTAERGRARRQAITTGLQNELEIEVVKGLRPGDQVVIKGFETLQNNARITILKD